MQLKETPCMGSLGWKVAIGNYPFYRFSHVDLFFWPTGIDTCQTGSLVIEKDKENFFIFFFFNLSSFHIFGNSFWRGLTTKKKAKKKQKII